MPARNPTPSPCRWPGCTSRGSGRHQLCARDRMRVGSLGVAPDTDPATLAALWAERQGAATTKRAALYPPSVAVVAGPCKAPDCTRPARAHGWCEACRKMIRKMGLDVDVAPAVFGEAKAARLTRTRPEPTPPPRPTRTKDAACRLRDDLRRVLGLDDGASDEEIVARAVRAVADLASQAHAAGELAQLVERHADAATVAMAERDVLAERVAVLEAELAAYRVPMTEEELRERGNALARAALDREWALARAPRGVR